MSASRISARCANTSSRISRYTGLALATKGFRSLKTATAWSARLSSACSIQRPVGASHHSLTHWSCAFFPRRMPHRPPSSPACGWSTHSSAGTLAASGSDSQRAGRSCRWALTTAIRDRGSLRFAAIAARPASCKASRSTGSCCSCASRARHGSRLAIAPADASITGCPPRRPRGPGSGSPDAN